MKLSEIFKVISSEMYGDEYRCLDRKCNMLKSDYCLNTVNPVSITGRYSIFQDESPVFEDKEIQLKENSILVYDETGHSGEWNITEFNSLEDVERFILSGAGYFNMFCTSIIVFTYEKVLNFGVYYVENNKKIFLNKDDDICDGYDFKIEWN